MENQPEQLPEDSEDKKKEEKDNKPMSPEELKYFLLVINELTAN